MLSKMVYVIKSQVHATSIPEYSCESHRIFENNPRCPFIIKLNDMVIPDENSEENFVTSQNTENLAQLIDETAVLNSRHNKNETVSVIS